MGIIFQRHMLHLVDMSCIVTPLSRERGAGQRQGLGKAWLPALAGSGQTLGKCLCF